MRRDAIVLFLFYFYYYFCIGPAFRSIRRKFPPRVTQVVGRYRIRRGMLLVLFLFLFFPSHSHQISSSMKGFPPEQVKEMKEDFERYRATKASLEKKHETDMKKMREESEKSWNDKYQTILKDVLPEGSKVRSVEPNQWRG